MKNFRWVTAGFALGLLIALGPSCGPGNNKKCDITTCSGCCTADGTCEQGTQPTACGVNAALCAVCTGTEFCQGGFCTPLSTGTGKDGGNNNNNSDGGNNVDGGTGDGGTAACDSTNCSDGCCVGDVCRRGADNNNLTCGTGGQACQQCTGSLTCQSGVCKDTTCSGCISGSSCLTGTTTAACGTGGVQCVACQSGQTCTNGVCTGGNTTCNSTNCSGCCLNNVCQTGTTTSACGVGGATCQTCSSNQTCTSGACQTTTTVTYGSPCTSNTQCSALGTGAVCKLTTSSGNATYSGGYCTKPCAMSSDCGGTAFCYDLSFYGEAGGYCFDGCSSADPCRSGYQCYNFSNPACWISPLPQPPVAPSGLIGSACATDSACQNNGQYPAGGCIAETGSNGATGFTSGYCTATCSASLATCGTTGECITFGEMDPINLCTDRCSAPGTGQSDCRPGYVCEPANLADGGTIGFCWPNCHNVSGWCGAQTCQANGYCQ